MPVTVKCAIVTHGRDKEETMYVAELYKTKVHS